MFIAFMQVSASTLAQKVTLSDKNAPLTVVFNQISAQTGFDFAYTGTILNSAKLVTIDVKNEELADVLKKIFDDQPLDYSIEDRSVVVTKKEPSFFDKVKDKAAKVFDLSADITGRVVDSLGQPLIGASVSLKDTKYSTLTDNQGSFTFPSIPQGKYTLIITYIGYTRLEEIIETEGKTLNLRLILHTATSSLDQVQVIAYGIESKRFSVGSIATVNAETIEKQPVTNPLLALEGQAPGLAVTAMNGVPYQRYWCR